MTTPNALAALGTPADAFDRLLPSPAEEIDDVLATEVSTDE